MYLKCALFESENVQLIYSFESQNILSALITIKLKNLLTVNNLTK